MAYVLVAEDDDDIADTVCDLLKSEGHTVAHARNGQEAMTALHARGRPCLILLDLMMPVMSGWAVLEALHKDVTLGPIPVVVTSAVPDERAATLADRVIRKPYDLDMLLGVVDRFCSATSKDLPV